MVGTVGFSDVWRTERDILHSNDDVLIGNIEFDVTAKVVDDFFIGTDTDVSNDTLHSGQLVVGGRNTVVVGSKLVVDKASFSEK